jgi:transketolase
LSLTSSASVKDLEAIAKRVRRHIITMTKTAGSGHPGGSLSCADILVALYGRVLRQDPQDPAWPDRDRFILSKGHAAPALYAVLAEQGYFSPDELVTLRKLDSPLQGHTVAGSPPGVEMTSGSLGQGLSFALGQALAARLDGRDYRVYCLLGDGDCNEGQTWEAAMACTHHRMDNLTAIVDYNRLQNDGFSDYSRYQDRSRPERVGGWVGPEGHTVNILSLEPLTERWQAFGWQVLEVDGHNIEALMTALDKAKGTKGRPTVIIAHTVKGKGVSFMENNPAFHGKAPTQEQAEQALKELA